MISGHTKYRALRLENGNFAWASESTTRKTRIIDGAAFHRLCVVDVFSCLQRLQQRVGAHQDSREELHCANRCHPFPSVVSLHSPNFKLTCARYEKHYSLPIGRKKVAKGAEKAADDVLNKKHSKHVQAILAGRKSLAPVESKLEEQFATGRLYG